MSLKNVPFTAGASKNARVLDSEEDFDRWYREQYDFSMFTDKELEDVMQDERPRNYPCIPYIPKGSYQVFYFGEDLIEHWFRTLSEYRREN